MDIAIAILVRHRTPWSRVIINIRKLRREGNGGLHRRLSGRHTLSASIPSGLAGILEKYLAVIGPGGRRVLGRHIRRRWEMHHAGCDALAESAHARLLSGPEFTCQSARRHAGWRNKLFGFHVGKRNFTFLFLTIFNIFARMCLTSNDIIHHSINIINTYRN